MRRPQGRDGREQAERRLVAPEVDGQDRRTGLAGRRDLRGRRQARKGEQAREQLGGLPSAVRDSVGLHSAEKVKGDLLPVHDEGPQAVGGHERHREVHRLRGGRGRRRGGPGEELDEAPRARVGAQQVPAPVHDERRVRLLLGQHVVQRAVHLGELRRGEITLAPGRRKTGREEERVVLAQREIEHRGEPQDHLPARAGAPGLEKAEMTLGGPGGASQIELREAATLAPPAQPRPEAGRRLAEGRRDGPGPHARSPPVPCSPGALRAPSGGCSPR